MVRHVTEEDLVIIQDIILQFRIKPTWPLIKERAQAAGLDFAQVTLTRNKSIIKMKKEQEEKFLNKKKIAKGLPQNDPRLLDKNMVLEGEVKRLKEQLRQQSEYTEKIKGNAIKLGIPMADIGRKPANRNGNS